MQIDARSSPAFRAAPRDGFRAHGIATDRVESGAVAARRGRLTSLRHRAGR
jgi:hypothetical protein